jgi:phage gpG-like protein
MAKKDKFDLDGVIKRLEQTKSELPKIFANDAQTFFEKSFKRQGWTDESFTHWKPRKKSKKGRDRTRAILVKSGFLRRNFSIKSATFTNITISNSTPYAAIHNEGGVIHKKSRTFDLGFRKKRGTDAYVFASIGAKKKKARFVQTVTIGAHNINMPQRQFMGHSKALEKIQIAKINKALKEIWK